MAASPLPFDAPDPSEPAHRPEATRSFARRLGNAAVLLGVAVSLHIWLGRLPQDQQPQPTYAALPGVALSQAPPRPSRPRSLMGSPDIVAREVSTSGRAEGATAAVPDVLAPAGVGGTVAPARIRIVEDLLRVVAAATSQPAPGHRDPDPTHAAPFPAPPRDTRPSPTLRFAGLGSASSGLPGELSDAFAIVPAADWRPPVREQQARATAAPANPAAAAPLSAADDAERAAAADLEEQIVHVQRIIDEYARAYERLDVRAAQAIWPTVDPRRLQRAFKDLTAQEMRVSTCGVSIKGQAANARCPSEAIYRHKIGARTTGWSGDWLFSLTRRDGGWQIVDAQMQSDTLLQ